VLRTKRLRVQKALQKLNDVHDEVDFIEEEFSTSVESTPVHQSDLRKVSDMNIIQSESMECPTPENIQVCKPHTRKHSGL